MSAHRRACIAALGDEAHLAHDGMGIGTLLILANVLHEMRAADELGGCDTAEEYVLLMLAIQTACQGRIESALANKENDDA